MSDGTNPTGRTVTITSRADWERAGSEVADTPLAQVFYWWEKLRPDTPDPTTVPLSSFLLRITSYLCAEHGYTTYDAERLPTGEIAEILRKAVEKEEDRSDGHKEKPTRLQKRIEWLTKAMILVQEKPGLKDKEIAESVGVHPGTLSKRSEYQAAAAQARGNKGDRHRGHITKDADSGLHGVEAVAPPAGRPNDRSDRGEPIPGSKLFREHCEDCDEPMRVPKDQGASA